MKAIILCTALIGGLTLTLFGQTIVDAIRGIEVTGSAEKMVVPDQLTFRITLAERTGTRGKITIEQQESQLRTELEKIGVDVEKDLSIYDISSQYIRRRKDVLGRQDYRLMIRDLDKVAKLQEIADRINVDGLDLVLAENSHIAEIRRDLRIEAIRAAKTKAEYLLAAIGSRVGDAVYVKEVEEENRPVYYNYYAAANATAANTSAVQPLSFAPQKVHATILARFEIIK